DYSQNRTAVFQLAARIYQRRSPGPHRDRMDQERIVRESGLRWTLLKPPRLTEAGGKGDPEAAPDLKVGLMSSVSRIDLAHLIVSEVLTPRFVYETVFVRSGRGA
ncbi:MAG: NAD(P)H-binding protein, partial [Gemmatimonadota bacterium]|nr:NAD(P)H-binding protein [Gemmatimonadota bacterium]